MSRQILLVEDDVSIAGLIRDYLEIDGFSVEHAENGKTGLDLAVNKSYNLILLDVMLPEVNGFEICREIRKMSDVPVLLISARKEDIDKIRGLGLGADDYITKPFSPGELVARVKAHIRRYERLTSEKKSVRKNQISVRRLKLDIDSHRVYANNHEVILTSKEFEMLHLFMRYPDRVFSKDEIFNRIWGEDTLGDTTTVTVHIRKIREKIEDNPSEPAYLETVWGMGYRLRII
jgi:DNA-binding response OmpR family regulator